MNIVSEHLEKILNVYTKGEHYEDMKKAIEIFIDKTGKMDEDTDEYESRMNSFNDWFIFNYRKEDGTKIIDQYINDQNIDDELAKAFHNINYSLYLFQKINFRKQTVIKDILHSEKFILAKDNGHLALVEDDLFVGRVVKYKDEHYLLNGLCTLPREVLSILKKESKKVRKQNNFEKEEEFLLTLEGLKTKSLQYGHVESNKIFQF